MVPRHLDTIKQILTAFTPSSMVKTMTPSVKPGAGVFLRLCLRKIEHAKDHLETPVLTIHVTLVEASAVCISKCTLVVVVTAVYM